MKRFKIDFCGGGLYVFGLYFFAGKNWRGREKWSLIDSFERHEDAVALYEKIKDLPEYLA